MFDNFILGLSNGRESGNVSARPAVPSTDIFSRGSGKQFQLNPKTRPVGTQFGSGQGTSRSIFSAGDSESGILESRRVDSGNFMDAAVQNDEEEELLSQVDVVMLPNAATSAQRHTKKPVLPSSKKSAISQGFKPTAVVLKRQLREDLEIQLLETEIRKHEAETERAKAETEAWVEIKKSFTDIGDACKSVVGVLSRIIFMRADLSNIGQDGSNV